MFSREIQPGKTNVLFLDEPDVHLHPDLQKRLIQFLCSLVDKYEFRVIIATHSTAILGSLSDYSGGTVAFMKSSQMEVTFEPIGEVHRRILPIFGAHPLTHVFNETPALIVEGDDDERIWQQAVRSSKGQIRLYPVSCDGTPNMNRYESDVDRIVSCVYDTGMAFSLRDRDLESSGSDLDDFGVVRRLRLKCREAENLLLTNEVLEAAGVTFFEVRERITNWLETSVEHSRYQSMLAFKESGFDRMNHDLKDVRLLLVGQIFASNKPWEVLVGQVLGTYTSPAHGAAEVEGSLAQFLGHKILRHLFHQV